MSYEFMTLMCDICKERPVVETKKIKGEWKGVCRECGACKHIFKLTNRFVPTEGLPAQVSKCYICGFEDVISENCSRSR